MESNTIDDTYIISEKIGSGGTAKVFLVKEKDSEEVNVAKVLKEKNNDDFSKECFINEINILNFLKRNIDNTYIVKYINSGVGQVKRIGHPITKNRYLILGYEENGNLFDYVHFPKSGFSEKHSKLIFFKILKGLQEIHSKNICHRDIKLENILVDETYNPKICDFGFATLCKKKLKRYLGTPGYKSPQIVNNIPYNGLKNDIFSLGQTLMTLVTGCTGYLNDAEDDNELYKYIKFKKYDYWKIFENEEFKLTEEFKELYFDMLSYFEKKRPEIEEILDGKWMKEIKDLNENQMNDLENEVKSEFKRRKAIITQKKKTPKVEINQKSSELGTMRSGGNNEKNFNYNSKPYDIKSEKHFDNFVEIKTLLHPVTLMNELINKLLVKYSNKCKIVINENKLKFNIIFDKEKGKKEEIFEKMKEELKNLNINEIKFENENIDEYKNNEEKGEEEEEDEEEEEEENYDNKIKEKKSEIDVKLFKIKDNEYLLNFIKKEGDLEEFYNNVEKIRELLKNIN